MMVSTPKGLGSGCSVSAKFFYKDVEKAKIVLKMRKYASFNNFFALKTKGNRAVFEILPVNY